MPKRRRVKHTATFEERLAEEAERFRKAAERAKPDMERELLLKRAGQAETASQVSNWLKSPGLQPPK
jgi:predicted trehalose synthase